MKMKKLTVLIAVFSFLSMCCPVGNVCAETSATMDLVQMLTGQLGVTEPQATGGAGALFGMAQKMLSEKDYTQVAAAIPNIGDLIKAAPAVSESTTDVSRKVSGLAGGLGSITEAVDNANKFAAVYDQFEQLGLNADMVSQFIPILLSFAESAGGETVMNMLKSVWE